MEISEEHNKAMPKTKPIKEKMDTYIPDIIEGVARRNGSIALYVGSGGSGKTSFLLNQMKTVYKKKFHHIYYFCPSSSFASIKDHVFAKHDKVYNELEADTLEEIKNDLIERKENIEDDDEQEYSLIIIDDFANNLSGGTAQDGFARNVANTAASNTVILQGVNVTQNTNISNLTSWLSSNISLIDGINSTQNTDINTATNLAQSAYNIGVAANTTASAAASTGKAIALSIIFGG